MLSRCDFTVAGATKSYMRDGRIVCAWPTDDGLTLVGVNWPAVAYGAVRAPATG
jgi:hypothetical protein